MEKPRNKYKQGDIKNNMARDWNRIFGTIGIMLLVGGLTGIISLSQLTPRSITGLIIAVIAGIIGVITIAIVFSKK